MNNRIPRFLIYTSLAAVLVSFCLAASPLAAQQEATAASRAAVKSVQATPAVARTDPAGALRAAIEQCGAPCRMGGSGRIAAPGGGTLDHTCNDDGDCSCFGAKDCVAMADVCKEGTMGCNKQGCVCEEG